MVIISFYDPVLTDPDMNPEYQPWQCQYMHKPGKDWEQEEVAPACTPDLQSEPAVPYRTLCRTELGTLPAHREVGAL